MDNSSFVEKVPSHTAPSKELLSCIYTSRNKRTLRAVFKREFFILASTFTIVGYFKNITIEALKVFHFHRKKCN